MNAQEAVRQQLGFWHGIAGQVLGDCGDALNRRLADAKVGSVASIYAHVILSEDGIVNGMLQGKPTLFDSGGWTSKTGISPQSGPFQSEEWAAGVNMQLSSFQEYAQAVFAQTDTYLAGLSDDDLAKKVQGPVGESTVGWTIVNILATHFPQHIGEIAALKGVHGLKGLPF